MKRFSSRAVRIPALLALLCAAFATTLAASGVRPQESSPSAHASTSNAKKKKSHHRRSSGRQSFQKAPTPERISEIQGALSRGGYYQGQPNGKWDSNTVSALQKFQSDNGMNATGKLDAPSLQKLGLGSSTAGVDAPKPLSHSSPGATTTTSASGVAAAGTAPATSADPARASVSNVSATAPGPTAANSPSANAKPPQR